MDIPGISKEASMYFTFQRKRAYMEYLLSGEEWNKINISYINKSGRPK